MAVYNHYKRIHYESLLKSNIRLTDEGYVYSARSLSQNSNWKYLRVGFYIFLSDSSSGSISLFFLTQKTRHCYNVVEIWICRYGGLSAGHSDMEDEENDGVELEKSNVLLMGPTGSGSFKSLFISFH